MLTRFHKMHGLGNDFVVFDARDKAIEINQARVRGLADRHIGIGCDQLILVERTSGDASSMRIWNSDGSEVEACGNAARCVAALVGGGMIKTAGGDLLTETAADGTSVTLPPPRLAWDAIPLAYPMDTAELPVSWDALERPAAINVGNPHLVFFNEAYQAEQLIEVGGRIENDPLFPERINVNVATDYAGNALTILTWERGAGLTLACGTGACATAVVAIRRGFVASPVKVIMRGGDLIVEWAPGEPIRMTGPATHVFTGEIDLDAFG